MSEQLAHLVQEGIEAARRDDLERAETCFREALRLEPADPDALYNLGVLGYLRRDLDGALDLVSQCIAADPSRPKAHFQRGMVRHAKGDLRGALADFDRELEFHPEDVDTVLSRGATLSALGNPSEALAAYERAMHLAPRDPRPHFNRGLLRNESDPEGAILDFSAAIDREPSKAEAYMGRAILLRAKGRKQAALADLQIFLKLDGPRLHGKADLVMSWIRELENEIGRPSSPTPLSDLIRDHLKSPAQDSLARLMDAFRRARVGVLAFGAPEGTSGDFTSTSEHPISVGLSTDTDGQAVVLAFADPQAFAQRFGARFNAVASGEAVLQTALQNPDCRGVRVNSAKADVSIIFDRQAVASVFSASHAAPASSRRPRWKLS